MTYKDDFTLPTEYLEQLSEQGTEYLPERLQTEDGADPAGGHYFRHSPSTRRRLLSGNLRKGTTQRTSTNDGFGGDVGTRRVHSQGESHYREVVWHRGLFQPGEPSSQRTGRSPGSLAQPTFGRVCLPVSRYSVREGLPGCPSAGCAGIGCRRREFSRSAGHFGRFGGSERARSPRESLLVKPGGTRAARRAPDHQ